MMTNFADVSFYFIAPDVVKMGQDIKDELDEKGIRWEESEDLLGVASEVDVLYQTRIQRNGSATAGRVRGVSVRLFNLCMYGQLD